MPSKNGKTGSGTKNAELLRTKKYPQLRVFFTAAALNNQLSCYFNLSPYFVITRLAQFYNIALASTVVITADNAIKITKIAIAVKPKPRLDALLINKPQTLYCCFCAGNKPLVLNSYSKYQLIK
jgi:hypothetical protein